MLQCIPAPFKKETLGEGFDKKDQRPYLAEINHT